MRISISKILMCFLFSFMLLKNCILAEEHIWPLPLALKYLKARVDKAMHLYSQKDRLAKSSQAKPIAKCRDEVLVQRQSYLSERGFLNDQ